MSAIDDLYDRISSRAATIFDDEPDDVGGLREMLAELRAGVGLTPNFLAVREQAHVEMLATLDEFRATAEAHAAGVEWRATWWDFFIAEYRPQMTRALQDLMAAQLREHLELVILQFRTLRSKLVGLRVQRGDYA